MRVLSYLGIEPSEEKNTLLLIGNNFFEGLAISLFYSVALTYFLDHNPIKAYGWLMVSSAAFVMLFTVIYQKVEHALKTGNIFMFLAIMTLVVFVSGLCITMFNFGFSEARIGFVLMILHHFVYVLYKIRFWGLSALFFDVRQSKRLFGLIGSVNLPAKFIGFTLVTTLGVLSNVGFEKLLRFAVLSYLVSTIFMYLVIKRNPSKMDLGHHHDKYRSGHSRSIVKGIWWLSLVLVFSLSFISFLFAKEVQHHFEVENGNMFQLISVALAISYGLATIVKIAISGKVLGKYKLSTLLIITPIVLAIAILMHWILRSFFQFEDQEYLFFVMLMIASLVLTEAIDTPLIMSLFQPLSKKDILSGHTLVKGYGENIGVMLVGIALVLFYSGHKHIELSIAIPIVFAAALLWFWAARQFSTSYLYDLRHLIELKLITGKRVLFMDKETEQHLTAQIESGDEKIVAHAIEMLSENDRLHEIHLKRLLDSRRIQIRQLAINALKDQKLITKDLRIEMEDMLSDATESEKYNLLTVLCSTGTLDELQPYLDLEDPTERMAVANGLVMNSNPGFESWLQKQIDFWMTEENTEHQKHALSLMVSFVNPSNIPHIKQALKRPEFLPSAIQASEPYLIELKSDLLPHFTNRKVYRHLLDSFKDAPIEVILDFEEDLKVIGHAWLDICLESNRIEVNKLLIPYLKEENPEMRHAILKGLAPRFEITLSKDELSYFLDRENNLLEKLSFQVIDNQHLNHALEFERNAVIERILGYCYLHTKEKVLLNAQKELFLGGHNNMALCIEALQAALPISLFNPLRKLLEKRENPVVDVDRHYTNALLEIQNQLGQWLKLQLLDSWSELPNFEINKTLVDMKESKVERIDRVLMLKQTQLFEEIRDNRLLDIADLMHEVTIEKDQFVFKKGDQGDSIYIIVEGEIAIVDGGHELAKFGRGDFFGDLSLLDPAPRSAAAQAKSTSKLLCLDQPSIYELMYDHIEVVKGILGALCKRIRNQNRIYLEEKNKVSQHV